MEFFTTTKKLIAMSAMAITAVVTTSMPALADNQWGSYRWKEKPLTLEIVDNTTTDHHWWMGHLETANNDWDHGGTPERAGWATEDAVEIFRSSGMNTACNPVSGNVQVCNDNYGNTGWLGIAQIWISRGKNKYIVAGVAKMNDFYHDKSPYYSDSWRQLVMCQEVAHTFGLDHQDESFDNTNLGTCMDYTSNPSGNEHPNQHDYDQLEMMYTPSSEEEPDGKTCNPKSPKCQGADVPLETPGDWGRLVSGHGGIEIYEKELANGFRVITHVTWTLEHAKDDIHRR